MPRWISPLLKETVRHSPVTVVTGARQVGKSTLLVNELPGWRYLNLDDYDLLHQAERDPDALTGVGVRTIVDEAQKAPKLLAAIKKAVDKNPKARFVLSGSANLMLMSKVTESLAGRAVFFELGPMSRGEMQGRKAPGWFGDIMNGRKPSFGRQAGSEKALCSLVFDGGLPIVLHLRDARSLLRWREGYVASYLERDLRQLSQIENLSDFRRLMSMAALRSGQVLNKSAMGCDLGLSQPTAHRYVGLLETSMLVSQVQPYLPNPRQRLVKSPKLLWGDSGMASHLCGLHKAGALPGSREWGGLLECFVYEQIQALCALVTPRPRIFYWRTRSGQEVDLVVKYGKRILGIEIKAGSRVRYEDTVGLQSLALTCPEMVGGLALYSGEDVVKMSGLIYAVPFWALWGEE